MTAEQGTDFDDLGVAVAHWHVNAWGGAEYLATKLAEALSVDHVYTMGPPDPEDGNPYGDIRFVDVSSSLDYPRIRRLERTAGRTFEYAQWEDVDWCEFGRPDVLLTSGSTTRAVITPDDCLHVNYCHSPPRWLYDLYHDRKGSLTGRVARPLLRYLRIRDGNVDTRVDHYFANSPVIARRLWKYYDRESEVLYPPVDLGSYRPNGDEGFYLHLGRLDEEKGVPAVVRAFESSESRLVLAGGIGDVDGKTRERIERVENIDYRGFVSEAEKYDLLSTCRAVVFNGRNEDFGIVPIEANASGKACLARREGFPGMFIEDGENGYLHDGTSEDIENVVMRFEESGIDGSPREDVERFSYATFVSQLRDSLVAWYEAMDGRFVHQ